MLKKIPTLFSLLLCVGLSSCLLSGCSSQDDLDKFLEEKKAQPGGTLKPLPDFVPPEPFTYSAAGLRSPFQRPNNPTEKVEGIVAPAPDMGRPKEELEKFSMDQLTMVGTLQGADSKLWALLGDGAGGVYRVSEGNYIGRNFGKITKVYVDKIDVVEVVPDGRGGWLERPKVVELKEK